ncbi:MAG: efflux RND transporter periplasmic adaptor subunit, partial [Planctomycetota bacterium]
MTQRRTNPKSLGGWWISVLAVLGTGAIISAVVAAINITNANAAAEAESASQEVNTLPVRLLTLGEIDRPSVLQRYRGAIRPHKQARLAFRRGGPIQSVAVHAGDRFEKDQPLAQLDVSDLTSQAAALRARRDAAQAQLDELKSGPRTQTIAAAQAEVRRLTADVKLADTSRRRQETLNRQGATSQQNADAAKYQYQSLVAKLDAAQQKLSELEEGTRAEQIQAQTANVGVIDAELQQLEVSLNDSRIQAPFDGVVAQRFVDEGTIAGPTMPVLSVYTADEMEVRFGLPLAQSAALKAGDEVSVRLDDQRVLIAK